MQNVAKRIYRRAFESGATDAAGAGVGGSTIVVSVARVSGVRSSIIEGCVDARGYRKRLPYIPLCLIYPSLVYISHIFSTFYTNK
jgi:hypothetical protein